MSAKAGGLDSCGKCNEGTTDGVASRNGTSMADAIPRDEFCCCQLYRYESLPAKPRGLIYVSGLRVFLLLGSYRFELYYSAEAL